MRKDKITNVFTTKKGTFWIFFSNVRLIQVEIYKVLFFALFVQNFANKLFDLIYLNWESTTCPILQVPTGW